MHNSTGQCPSWEANKPSASQEIPCIYETCRFINAFTSACCLPCPYPEPDRSSPCLPITLLEDKFLYYPPSNMHNISISFFKKGSHLQGLDTKFYGISTLHFHCTVKNKQSNHTTVRPIITLRQSCSSLHRCGQIRQNWVCMQHSILYRKKKEWVYVNTIAHIISLVFFLYNICNNKCTDNNKNT